jgi:cyclophilin family peptidyl-prolyl cis-trans isomerase
LFKDRAPVSVENFLRYANDGFYAGTTFHRVKPAFMIQGGGYTETLTEKPTRPPIQNEATNGLRNTRGTVAMARLATLRSATSQFYINLVDNRSLDHAGFSPSEFGYAVFGRVLSGMDVADRIAAVPTRKSGDMEDVPVEPVFIKSVRVLKAPAAAASDPSTRYARSGSSRAKSRGERNASSGSAWDWGPTRIEDRGFAPRDPQSGPSRR